MIYASQFFCIERTYIKALRFGSNDFYIQLSALAIRMFDKRSRVLKKWISHWQQIMFFLWLLIGIVTLLYKCQSIHFSNIKVLKSCLFLTLFFSKTSTRLALYPLLSRHRIQQHLWLYTQKGQVRNSSGLVWAECSTLCFCFHAF